MENILINVCIESDKIDIHVKYIKIEDFFFLYYLKMRRYIQGTLKYGCPLAKMLN